MRRPIVFLFLFFALGIALAFHLKPEPFHFLIFAVLIVVLCGVSGVLRWQAGLLACLFLFASLLGSSCFYMTEHSEDPLERSEGEYCSIEGRIITVQRKSENSFQMLVTAPHGKRLVAVKGAMGDPGEYIGKRAAVRGTVVLPAERRNPGLFDYRLYLKTKGVRVILQTDSSHITLGTKDAHPLFSAIARIKYTFLNKLEKEMEPEAYGLMAGMLFGDCSDIGDDTYEAFQKNGIAHILSVSGIHVGIVYLFIGRLSGNRKTRTFYLITALALVLYAALSEFSPSVVRAVVMILIHMFSKVSYRRYDFLTCTSAGALGMLVVNPFYLFNAGFQLSFLAVFCLASGLPWINRRIDILEEKGKNEWMTIGLRGFSPLLLIQAGMAPLTAYMFNYFSVASFFLNPPIIAISGAIIPLGIGMLPLSFLGGPVFGVSAQAAELLIRIMLWLNELFYLPGLGFFNVVSPTVWFLLIFYGLFFFLTSEGFRILYQRRKGKAIAVCFVLILTVSLLASEAAGDGGARAGLVFVDVGQGDCLHIRTPSGKNILIDGGGSVNYEVGKKLLLPYLLKNGVKSVDLAIATHLHTDHYLGIAELARNMEIERLGVYAANRLREEEILDDTGLERRDLIYLAEGDRISIEKGVWIDVLYPEKKSSVEYESLILNEEDENRSCLFMKLFYQGLTVIITGDIGMEGEQEIMEIYRNSPGTMEADILKIGHHGSRFSTGDRFLDLVDPKIAVFQVGKNNFGHPHPSVIEKCQEKGIIIYRNDLNGAIIFEKEEQVWHTKVLLRKSMHIEE